MTRKTKAQLREEQAAAEAARLIQFRAELPQRLWNIAVGCERLGIRFEMLPDMTLHIHGMAWEETLSMESEEWLVDWAERQLKEIQEARDLEAERRQLASELLSKRLTAEEVAALRQHWNVD